MGRILFKSGPSLPGPSLPGPRLLVFRVSHLFTITYHVDDNY